eukprot:6173802-Pleurochrysis_carterae.AAC.1
MLLIAYRVRGTMETNHAYRCHESTHQSHRQYSYLSVVSFCSTVNRSTSEVGNTQSGLYEKAVSTCTSETP